MAQKNGEAYDGGALLTRRAQLLHTAQVRVGNSDTTLYVHTHSIMAQVNSDVLHNARNGFPSFYVTETTRKLHGRWRRLCGRMFWAVICTSIPSLLVFMNNFYRSS